MTNKHTHLRLGTATQDVSMTENFCSTFTCRKRHECKRALLIDELQAVKPYAHIDGYCRGFIPLNLDCIEPTSWFNRLFKLNW
jgi:hypothetical protein